MIRLARFGGLPHREITRRLGRSEGSVRTLLSRALAGPALKLEAHGE